MVPIALQAQRATFRRDQSIIDRRMRDLLEEKRLAHEVERVLRAEGRLGQPGKARELVDHLAQVADLPDDSAGEFVEQLSVLFDLLAIASLEPLGCQLDRGQRILDFMRDTTRNIRPRRLPLVEQLARDILEGDHMAIAFRPDLDREGQQFSIATVRDHTLRQAGTHHGTDLRGQVVEGHRRFRGIRTAAEH